MVISMAEFFAQNGGNLIVGAIVIVIIILSIRHARKIQKSGGCGCGCDGCASAGVCKPEE